MFFAENQYLLGSFARIGDDGRAKDAWFTFYCHRARDGNYSERALKSCNLKYKVSISNCFKKEGSSEVIESKRQYCFLMNWALCSNLNRRDYNFNHLQQLCLTFHVKSWISRGAYKGVDFEILHFKRHRSQAR